MKILVVDDEKLLVKGIKFNLENEGYTVDACYDGESAVNMARGGEYDLIILDLMMPKKDGLEACQEIRSFSTVPIIMLTARSEGADKLMGFESGADDYVTKPFNILELKARVRALLRRASLAAPAEAPEEGELKFGRISVDESRRRACKDGEPVELTMKEFGESRRFREIKGDHVIMLSGKVAIVTGASRGIGRETALTLAGYGATVIVNYCGSKDKAEAVVEEITAAGGTAKAYQGDVSDFDVAKEMITSVKKEFGSIDILVNNAGITKDNLIMKMSEEEFDKVIEVNLKGAFNCMKHVSRIMLKQRSGHIINMSSVSGVMGNAGQVNYCASKAGIIGMTKSLARELGSRGITVNAIAPGFIETEMTDVLPEDVKENLLTSIPLKRMGQTKDIAETVAFLASDKAAYITGQTISVDGGMGM